MTRSQPLCCVSRTQQVSVVAAHDRLIGQECVSRSSGWDWIHAVTAGEFHVPRRAGEIDVIEPCGLTVDNAQPNVLCRVKRSRGGNAFYLLFEWRV